MVTGLLRTTGNMRDAWRVTRDASNQLSYEATDVGSWSFVSSNEPVKNGCEVIYEMFETCLKYETFHISLHTHSSFSGIKTEMKLHVCLLFSLLYQ